MEAATTVRDLKTIICTIIENHPGVGIRFRTLGQLWYPGFLKIVKIDDKRLQLFDETRKFSISLRDLSAITQFELDANLGPFKPHFQYQVSEYNAGRN